MKINIRFLYKAIKCIKKYSVLNTNKINKMPDYIF